MNSATGQFRARVKGVLSSYTYSWALQEGGLEGQLLFSRTGSPNFIHSVGLRSTYGRISLLFIYFLFLTVYYNKISKYITNSEIICKWRKSSRRLRNALMGITRLKTAGLCFIGLWCGCACPASPSAWTVSSMSILHLFQWDCSKRFVDIGFFSALFNSIWNLICKTINFQIC